MKDENIIAPLNTNSNADIIKLIKEFWDERKFIIKITLLFAAFGLIVAIFTKNQYTSSTTFVPSTQGKSISSNLGGLASLAGINLSGGGNSSEISPELYPEILKSVHYYRELLETSLSINGQDTPVSYKKYYKEIYSGGFLSYLKEYTIGLPSLIISLFKADNKSTESSLISNNLAITSVSVEDYSLIKQLENQIKLEVNTEEGFVTISATMPEANASAQLALRAQELLQEYALKFKTQKSKEQLSYIEARFLEQKKEFNSKKIELASFEDQNNSINTALGKTKLLQLQSEYQLAFNVYNELAKQLEAQRLQVKQDSPLFTVLNPVTVPVLRSGPRRSLILISYILIGLIFSIAFIKLKQVYFVLKKNWF